MAKLKMITETAAEDRKEEAAMKKVKKHKKKSRGK
jgi:hypothetical protein